MLVQLEIKAETKGKEAVGKEKWKKRRRDMGDWKAAKMLKKRQDQEVESESQENSQEAKRTHQTDTNHKKCAVHVHGKDQSMIMEGVQGQRRWTWMHSKWHWDRYYFGHYCNSEGQGTGWEWFMSLDVGSMKTVLKITHLSSLPSQHDALQKLLG